MSGDLASEPLFVDVELLGRPRVEFITHARDRLRQRRVTVEQAIEAVREPDVTGLPVDTFSHPAALPRFRVRRQQSARSDLDVVYELEPALVRIITVIVKGR